MEKVRIGVVGLGVGRGHLRNYKACPNAEVVAVCDQDETRLEQFAEEYKVPLRFKDYGEMFASGKLDAVSIALPNFLHAPATIAALKSGLHVLCEKPMATNAREAQRMMDAAKAAGKKLMISFNYRFTEQSQLLKRYIDDGELGEIYFARTGWHRNRGIPKLGSWFGVKSMSGGGPLIDLGVHRLDMALWFMGHPRPVSVAGATYDYLGAKFAEERGAKLDVEDLAVAFVRFEGNKTLILEASWMTNSEKAEDMFTQLYGTKGGAIQRNVGEGYQFELKVFREECGAFVEVNPKKVLLNLETTQQHFVNCIIEDREPIAPAQHGVDVMKILDGIYRSSELGREVKIK
ncbi:MAG: Gfo/Idh/MocA family protein [bacterium]